MKKLLVVDGNSILNRQYYGSRPLSTKSGIPSGATYGFVKAILSQIDELAPDYCAIAFDVHAPTFRHKVYADYKAGRHETPDDLLAQFPYTKRFSKALGISVIEKEGYEADDILGTLSNYAEKEGVESFILTGDRDSLQLISDKTTVILATNGEYKRMDEKAFFEKYNVTPDMFVDVKALMGDTSDNIPGVPGIGEKTALKLIAEHKDLEGVYSYAEKEAESCKVPSMIQKLIAGKESAFSSRFLAKIEREAPIGITLEDTKLKEYDKNELSSLCSELEFASLAQRFELDNIAEKESALDYIEIKADELSEYPFESPAAVLFDEKTLFVYDGKNPVFVSIEESGNEILDKLFGRDIPFVLYDVKSVFHTIERYTDTSKIKVAYDVLLASYVLDSTEGSYTLERLSSEYLSCLPDEKNKAVTLYNLYKETEKALEKENMLSLYNDIEAPLAMTLYRMEKTGFRIDIPTLLNFESKLDSQIFSYMNEIYSLAGREFNISSPKQLGEVLFDELKLPAPKKKKTGYSTNADVLSDLKGVHPIIDLVLKYRQVTKLKSTYTQSLIKVTDEDSRIHTTFTQTVTATGRLSSIEPNLQNIPVRTELGREMRRFFVAKEGYLLVDADYSQIELRLLAAISGDHEMIEAFRSGIDIHTVTASQVFGVPIDEVTPEMRKRAKAVNFGIVYGISDYSLACDLQIPMAKASEYIKNYKEKYKVIASYLSDIIGFAYQNGYVTTLFGRKRVIPELSSPKIPLRQFGERVAMNSPIQGSAADIIKIAMLNVEKALEKENVDAKLILQVHDELIVEASEKDAERAKEILVREMENAVSLEVPLTVSADIGKTWYDCK